MAEEITNEIKRIRKQRPGLSQIKKPELANLPPSMICRFTAIFNAFLACGHFPSSFRTATISLIIKVRKTPNRPENFRLISLLEVPGKILEKIINKRIKAHLENKNLINPNQYRFRKARETISVIAITYEGIALALGNKKQVKVVLLIRYGTQA